MKLGELLKKHNFTGQPTTIPSEHKIKVSIFTRNTLTENNILIQEWSPSLFAQGQTGMIKVAILLHTGSWWLATGS